MKRDAGKAFRSRQIAEFQLTLFKHLTRGPAKIGSNERIGGIQ